MKNISLTNFKVFKDAKKFDFSPITLLTGKNNSGKSSLLKSLLLLDDYLKSNNQLLIRLDGNNYKKHKINTLSNLCSWENTTKTFNISYTTESTHELSFDFSGNADDNYALLKRFGWTFNKRELSVEIISDQSFMINIDKGFLSKLSFFEGVDIKSDRAKYEKSIATVTKKIKDIDIVILNSKVDSESHKSAIQARLQEDRRLRIMKRTLKEISIDMPQKAIKNLVEINEESHVSISHISQILRYGMKELELNEEIAKDKLDIPVFFKVQEILLQSMDLNIHHLSANRNIQERIFVAGDQNQEIFNLIDAYQRTIIKKGSRGSVFAKTWLKRFELGNDIKTQLYEGGIAKAVQIYRNETWRNLADLGFGASQLITIILKVASVLDIQNINNRVHFSRRISDNLLLIEEPEANLHPNFQSILAEMFADAVNISKSAGNKLTVILETHSEYMLRYFQLLCVSKKMPITISADTIKIYYLENGISFNINVNIDGSLSAPFGKGFTDVADETALELYKIQRNSIKL